MCSICGVPRKDSLMQCGVWSCCMQRLFWKVEICTKTWMYSIYTELHTASQCMHSYNILLDVYFGSFPFIHSTCVRVNVKLFFNLFIVRVHTVKVDGWILLSVGNDKVYCRTIWLENNSFIYEQRSTCTCFVQVVIGTWRNQKKYQ